MTEEYVKSEKIIETRWRCPFCQQENRGRDMKCSRCSAPKDDASTYEVDVNAEAIEDEALLADAAAGEHWLCRYCSKQNRGRRDKCTSCGAAQSLSPSKPGDEPPPPPPPPKKGRGCLYGVLGLLALLVFVIWAFWPGPTKATVTAMGWEQMVHLQQKTLVHKDGWQGAVPADAFNRSCERRQKTTKQVVDHHKTVSKTRTVKYQSGTREKCKTVTKDLGNGYASSKEVCTQEPEYSSRQESYTEQQPVYRTEPVFDEFCRYDVYEWPRVETATRSGQGTEGLVWPEASELKGFGPATIECDQRKAAADATHCWAREGRYRVTFADAENPENQPVYPAKSVEEYATFALGQSRLLEIDGDKVELVAEEE